MNYSARDFRPEQKARKLSAEDQKALVEEVRQNIEDAYNFERLNRIEAETDLDFLRGNQWPEYAKAEREGKRPMLTVNTLPAFVRQVTNPIRESDIAIAVRPEEGADVPLAKTLGDLIRQIEHLSMAKAAYVQGNEHQVGCGVGWWQVVTQYVDDSAAFDQEIRLRKIDMPLSVYCDPAAVLPCREDAMWMAVVEDWPRAAFKKKYPKATESDVDAPDLGTRASRGFMWSSKDTVAVAMYYRKVPIKKILAQLASGKTVDVTELRPEEAMAAHQDDPIVNARECETYKVEKYIVSGLDVLEGPVDWAGKYIPLIPAIGAETPTRDGLYRYGVVRFARDPQQMLNFYRTAAVEGIALAPKAPFIGTQKQVQKHKDMWINANRDNRAILLWDVDPDNPQLPPPQRQNPPDMPVAAMQQGEVSAEDMRRVMNIYEANVGAKSNETSGAAIQARAAGGDLANMHYSDNLVLSITHTGRVLIDLIPKIYDNERSIRLRNADGQEYTAEINKVVMTFDGQAVVQNDLSVGRYDVRVTVGKNYLTKRVEALSMMLEFAKTLPPEAQMLFLDLIAQNSDWPGAEELAKRFRNLVPKEALIDPEDPSTFPPPEEPDPLMLAQLAKLEQEINNLAEQARNKAADTELKEAQTYKTLAEADQADAETDHQIIIPSIVGSPPSGARSRMNGAKPNGAAPPSH